MNVVITGHQHPRRGGRGGLRMVSFLRQSKIFGRPGLGVSEAPGYSNPKLRSGADQCISQATEHNHFCAMSRSRWPVEDATTCDTHGKRTNTSPLAVREAGTDTFSSCDKTRRCRQNTKLRIAVRTVSQPLLRKHHEALARQRAPPRNHTQTQTTTRTNTHTGETHRTQNTDPLCNRSFPSSI